MMTEEGGGKSYQKFADVICEQPLITRIALEWRRASVTLHSFENRCFNKPEDNSASFNKEWTSTEYGEREKSFALLHMKDIILDFYISELQVTLSSYCSQSLKTYPSKQFSWKFENRIGKCICFIVYLILSWSWRRPRVWYLYRVWALSVSVSNHSN